MNSFSKFEPYVSFSQAQFIQMIHKKLTDAQIPYQFTGGLAALFYGAQRQLVDIDLDVESFNMPRVLQLFPESRTILPFQRYIGENWDIEMVTLGFGEVVVDICSGDRAFCRPDQDSRFFKVPFSLDESKVFPFGESDVSVRVVQLKDLVAYKMVLNREVDQKDLGAIKKELESYLP